MGRHRRLIVAALAALGLAGAGLALVATPAVASAPAAPPGCLSSLATYSNPAAVPIPDNDSTSSAITVAGAGPVLQDVDVVTNLTHTFPADIDMTLTSPEGTVVTLTTDNGLTRDNVFNGTRWDDDADPDSQAPYAVNPNIVTDHTYSNNVVVPTLTPEEALGHFVGENPNGTWTLTIVDDTDEDSGTLNGWSLDLATLAAAPVTTTSTFTNGTDVAVTDVATVTSTVNVSTPEHYLQFLSVTTFLQHTFPGDLDVTVQSPAGTVVSLTTDNGGTSDNIFNGTVWRDDADDPVTERSYTNGVPVTPLSPEEALAAFVGEDPNGTWTLTVRDDTAVDVGLIDTWSVNVARGACGSVDARIRKNNGTFAGNGIVNTTGAGQTRTASIPRSASVTYTIEVQNDGAVFPDQFRIRGQGGNQRFIVRYRDAAGNLITGQVVGPDGFVTPSVAPGASYAITMIVTARKYGPSGSTLNRLVTASSESSSSLADTVRTVTIRA